MAHSGRRILRLSRDRGRQGYSCYVYHSQSGQKSDHDFERERLTMKIEGQDKPQKHDYPAAES